jgi:UrcA family protein
MTATKIILTSFVITAGLIRGAPTLAQPAFAPNVNVSIVHTADLDLSTDAGRHQLDRRLVQAAREVCGTASDFDLEGKNDVRACRSEVLAKVRATGEQLAGGGAQIRVAASR